MRKTLLAILILAGALSAQDKGKEAVEAPIKKNLGAAPDKFDLSSTGIEWKRGLDGALNQGKPVLLFQLLGNFDDVYC